ncbi:ATP-binding mismatch repair protein ASCRUDRAFT_81886 [Ascoidea rubescens DSM 1968]|uniref:DNA mismatch repair protein MutL n=1 Tax=Ascoidea rubescens DSM 1968 TaxID=1344418 RepID=A0A1D2VDN7_9ASCO|nr:hypothetical protein ASCRUDRAFT_81886 [Ascoidea rubescens DSM 1968]ODV59577.1 hypothetical protein ASCRUDRAFT_81886 [Ascoidea rubescens DSM 1968]
MSRLNIAKINNVDIQKINSGQVIIDLQTAVKELVENSLDANSTSIEILFKNYGIDSIEVIDNGDGIDRLDFKNIALNSYTSKLSSFDDLDILNSFGFRGEAIHSLVSTSKSFQITTATKETYPKASILNFGSNGLLISIKPTTRNVGTSSLITNLFENLPVRRKNFIKNHKREFNKAIELLTNYCLITENVRLKIFNILPKRNNKNLIIATKGLNNKLKDNIYSVFGSKIFNFKSLIEIDFSLNLFSTSKVKLVGYLSNPSPKMGVKSPSHQYIFVNSRPVILKNLKDLLNNLYKSFNLLQYPVFFLNLKINLNMIDINVTPDKRTILIQNETEILNLIKSKILDLYHNSDAEISKNNFKSSPFTNDKIDCDLEPKDIEENCKSLDSNTDNDIKTLIEDNNTSCMFERPTKRLKNNNLSNYTTSILKSFTNDLSGDSFSEKNAFQHYINNNIDNDSKIKENSFDIQKKHNDYHECNKTVNPSLQELNNGLEVTIFEGFGDKSNNNENSTEVSNSINAITNESKNVFNIASNNNFNDFSSQSDSVFCQLNINKSHLGLINKSDANKIVADINNDDKGIKKIKGDNKSKEILNRNDQLSKTFFNQKKLKNRESQNQLIVTNAFRMGEITQEFNEQETTEEQLTLKVNKKDFLEMKIVGQFNLGFILATSKHENLFIIDQHASDEKFNFEQLRKNTKFQRQRLISPINVELAIIDEMIVKDNIEMIEKNGFKIRVNENNKAGFKIELISIPISKKTVFDLSDFIELVYKIKENQSGGYKINNEVSCSKIYSMFASRACRMSIMIGKPLNISKMKKVVSNLSQLDKPWNCPHGRPTMRHLMELTKIETFIEDYTI